MNPKAREAFAAAEDRVWREESPWSRYENGKWVRCEEPEPIVHSRRPINDGSGGKAKADKRGARVNVDGSVSWVLPDQADPIAEAGPPRERLERWIKFSAEEKQPFEKRANLNNAGETTTSEELEYAAYYLFARQRNQVPANLQQYRAFLKCNRRKRAIPRTPVFGTTKNE